MPLDTFLSPIDAPTPAGTELRNDARFHAIEAMLLPASRDKRKEARDSDPAVDWDEALRLCEELAAEGRDLRLLVIVARVLANSQGFAGAAEGLGLLARTIDTYWDSLHPDLRDGPSPRDAARRRIAALAQLESEDSGLLCDLRHMGVFSLRALGRVTGDDLAAASLSAAAFLAEQAQGLGEKDKAEMAKEHEARGNRVLTACRVLADEQPDRLAALAGEIEAARAALADLEARVSARVAENGAGERYRGLERLLERAAATLGHIFKAAGQRQGSAEAAETAGAIPAAVSVAGTLGPVASRRDVERALDQIIAFYEATEPASPIPLLARRMRKMVPMTFLQLIEEMAPSGMKEVRNLAGAADEKAKS